MADVALPFLIFWAALKVTKNILSLKNVGNLMKMLYFSLGSPRYALVKNSVSSIG